jgi:hypothetical protein
MSSIDDWRAVSRRGVLEVLNLLDKNGQMRFSRINNAVHGLCLASLTSALELADGLDLIKKRSCRIADDGSLQEIPKEDLEKGVKPQVSFYEIREKGREVVELQRRLATILATSS